MTPFPHRYSVFALGSGGGDVSLTAAGVPPLHSDSPPEFGGPDNRWSPETMLVASLADCFILTFRAVARAARLPWLSLTCDATGTLDRVERVTKFVGFELRAQLTVRDGADVEEARRLLEKSETQCLISNSLNAPVRLALSIETIAAPAEAA